MLIFVIKELRKSRKLTLYDLSKRAGISRSYLLDLENSRRINPSFSTLRKIADALDVSVKELFYSEIEIENLREELHKRIDKFGLDSKEVYEISQIIDLLVNIDMNKN